MPRPSSLWPAVALAVCLLALVLASAGKEDGRRSRQVSIRVTLAGPPREPLLSQPQLEDALRSWATGLAGGAWEATLSASTTGARGASTLVVTYRPVGGGGDGAARLAARLNRALAADPDSVQAALDGAGVKCLPCSAWRATAVVDAGGRELVLAPSFGLRVVGDVSGVRCLPGGRKRGRVTWAQPVGV